MNKTSCEPNSVKKCPSKVVLGEAKDPKESAKNGLVNGLVHNKKHKKNTNLSQEKIEACENLRLDIIDVKVTEINDLDQNHIDDIVNRVGKSKKRSKKKKHKVAQLDSNENLNDNKLEEINDETESKECYLSSKIANDVEVLENEIGSSPSCSKTSTSTDDIRSTEDISDQLHISSDIEKLVLSDESIQNDEVKLCDKKIEFVQYESELQMPMIMKIIQKDLSEPYSIYTYRYFIHNWPKLCFLAMHKGQCVGAIVCKLDLHRKVIRRGYIAMLAVDQNYRKLRIGSTLVQMAIHEMTIGDADEVVLETEVTNKPALKLYEKLGFVRDKRLFRYYLNGVDALRLKLWLR